MTDPTPTRENTVRLDNWIVLLDPSWQAGTPEEQPPQQAIAGGWPLDDEGRAGPFQPNQNFAPSNPATPTDPTDAVLRLAAKGEVTGDKVVSAVLDAVVHIAVDEQNHLLVGSAPDGVPCVAVATAAAHQARVGAVRWSSVAGTKLPDIVPSGVDILLNPEGPAACRLRADALRPS